MRRISLRSKLVLLTENHCCDVAEAALQEGASGYVIKADFAGELIPAVEAVIEGRPFLSARTQLQMA
jgi:DNA-binding NarL/FixJ family response regulator